MNQATFHRGGELPRSELHLATFLEPIKWPTEVSGNVQNLQAPGAMVRDLLSALEADIDATKTARLGRYVNAESYAVFVLQKL